MIGGRVLDASALAGRRYSVLVWFGIAPALGLTLYLPTLALAEVRALRPDAAPLLADLLTHSSVLVGELDAATAAQVDRLLRDTDVFDGGAGRLRRVDPALPLELL